MIVPPNVTRSAQRHDQSGEEHANAVGHDDAAVEQALAEGIDPSDLADGALVVTNPPVRKPV